MLQIAAWLHGQTRRQSLRGWGERTPASVNGDVQPAGAGNAFSRAVARNATLAPTDSSQDSLDEWMAKTGATPEDLDDIRELCGWLIPVPEIQPTALEIPEFGNPGMLDPEEFPENAPDVVTYQSAAPTLQSRRKIKSAEAAILLVNWCRSKGRCGTYSDREFSELCEEFYEAEGITPIYANQIRPHLMKMVDAITKSRIDSGDGKKNKRERLFRWTVHESETESDSIPWTELPERQLQAA